MEPGLKYALGFLLLALGLVFTVGGFRLIRRVPWLGAVLTVSGIWDGCRFVLLDVVSGAFVYRRRSERPRHRMGQEAHRGWRSREGQAMSKSFWTTGRIAGALLVLGFALIVAQFIVVLVQGKFGGGGGGLARRRRDRRESFRLS